MFFGGKLGQHGVAHTEVTAQSDADQNPTQKQPHRRFGVELHDRRHGDQHKADQENLLPTDLVGNPAKEQAAEKQTDQR